jgi:dual specificity tyrosine-phosphorylation-regulated kinase 2/3/4
MSDDHVLKNQGSSKPSTPTSYETIEIITEDHDLKSKVSVKPGSLTAYEILEIKEFKNNVYYDGWKCKKKRAINDLNFCKDTDGGYICHTSDHIYYRYELIKGIGKGAFGKVYLVFDHKDQKEKALKIIRSERRFVKQARVEAHILSKLNKNKAKHVVKMEDMFIFREHPCFVFEFYKSDNFYQELKNGGFKGMDIKLVQKCALHILKALKDIHALSIIHCDLKPENLIFENSETKDNIKVIDFGSSCYINNKLHNYIQSRYYRSPEVILMLGYNTKIDIWSFGAIIYELLKAEPLFRGKTENEVLNYMFKVLGTPPHEYIKKSSRFQDFFDIEYNFLKTSTRIERRTKPLTETLTEYHPSLLNMLKKCFSWNPDERPTAEDLLDEEFFKIKF